MGASRGAPELGKVLAPGMVQSNDQVSVAAAVSDHEEVRRAHGFHALRVKRTVQETDDTRSYVLEVPDDLRDTFRYEPGQFCTFRVRFGNDVHLRSYSMSSAPGLDPDLVVTVKRVPGGLVSNWFNDTVVEASILEVTRPAGVFCVRPGDTPIIAFCGGSGITPVMSIAKSVLESTERSLKLLYANRDRSSVIFARTLRDLAAAHYGRLEVRHHFDADGGYLTAGEVARFAKNSIDADFYICGPGAFMRLVESSLATLGIPPGRILIERFETSDVASSGSHPAEAPGEGPAVAPFEATAGGGPQTPEALTLILKGNSTTIAYRAGDTVLETARRGGLRPPFSCEAGNCATCMALLRQGAVTMRTNNALTDEEVEDGWILTCQALPRGNTVTVEYEAL